MDLEVTGNLTIASDGIVSARNGGLRKAHNNTEQGLTPSGQKNGGVKRYNFTLR